MDFNLDKKTLTAGIRSLDFENLNVVQIYNLLQKQFDIAEIQKALKELKKQVGEFKVNDFGKCGIDPEVNPCGDADDY